MSEQVGSVTRKKSSDFHGGIRFQSSFIIRWELEDKTFLKIDIINFIPFSNSVTFRKPWGRDLVTASELIPGFCRSRPRRRFARSKARQGDSLRHQIPTPCPHSAPHGIYIDRCIKLQLLLHEIKKRKERKYIVVRFTFAKCSNVCSWKQAHIYKVLKEAFF